MTRLLALVRGLAEAEAACAAGADIVELDAPAAVAAALVRTLDGRARSCLRIATPAEAPAGMAVDYLRCDWPADGVFAPVSGADGIFGAAAAKTIGIVAPAAAVAQAPLAAEAGLAGLMIDTTPSGRLLERVTIAELDAFTTACRAAGLLAALGSLEAPDVPRLLRLKPDILSFRGALRRNGRFDPTTLAIIRDLVRQRADAETPDPTADGTDRIFVRDFVVQASIGAYGRERGARQRVRFNVDVDVARQGRMARDMRDIFSYDLVLDAIRLILDRGHVALVETLAEQVAAAVLQHRRVVRVDVRVEKLDMIEGTLGVAITRTRADLTQEA